MPIKPIRDLVYIIPIEDPLKVKNNTLIVAERARQKIDHGIIKYKGPQVNGLSVGDHVIFSGWSGTRMAVSDEGLLIVIEEEWIDGIWEKGPSNRVYSEEQILNWITRSCNKLAVRGYAAPIVNSLESDLKAFVTGFFEEEGLMF